MGLTDEQQSTVLQMAGAGASPEEIADALGMSRRTYYRRRRQDPAFHESVKEITGAPLTTSPAPDLTREVKDAIEALVRAGETAAEIADALGCSPTTYHRLRRQDPAFNERMKALVKEHNVGKWGVTLTETTKDLIENMIIDGYEAHDIADALGCSVRRYNAVRRQDPAFNERMKALHSSPRELDESEMTAVEEMIRRGLNACDIAKSLGCSEGTYHRARWRADPAFHRRMYRLALDRREYKHYVYRTNGFSSDDKDRIERMIREGKEAHEIAAALGMSQGSYYRLRQQDYEWHERMKTLKRQADREETPGLFDGQPQDHDEVMRRAAEVLKRR